MKTGYFYIHTGIQVYIPAKYIKNPTVCLDIETCVKKSVHYVGSYNNLNLTEENPESNAGSKNTCQYPF